MSHTYIDTYDGDPYDFIRDANGDHALGEKTTDAHSFTDGEEIEAAIKILELLNAGTHFDVRNEVN